MGSHRIEVPAGEIDDVLPVFDLLLPMLTASLDIDVFNKAGISPHLRHLVESDITQQWHHPQDMDTHHTVCWHVAHAAKELRHQSLKLAEQASCFKLGAAPPQ